MRPAGKRAMVFLAAAAVTAATLINFCNLVFQCGCRSLWAGAAEACNIHAASGPHCPWCTHGGYPAYLSFGLILAVQATIALGPFRIGAWSRFFWALVAFPVVGGIAALVSGLATGYWSS